MKSINRLIALSPAVAFVLINSGLVIGSAIWIRAMAGPTQSVLFVFSRLVSALFFLGWPTLVAVFLLRHYGIGSDGGLRLVLLAFVGALVAHGCVWLLWVIPDGDPVWVALATVTWILGFMGPIYLLIYASRALVMAETGKPVPLDRWLGTLLLFLCLPIGVIFIQRRVRKIAMEHG